MSDQFPFMIHAQAILQGVSGLSKDRYINTFHFLVAGGGTPVAQDYTDVAARVSLFYTTVQSLGFSVGSFISPSVLRTANSCSVRMYDMGSTHPRIPTVVPFTLPAAGVNTALPNEVAVCLSYYAILNRVGQRGRVYVGPLSTQALATEVNVPDVLPGLQTTLLDAADGLHTQLTTQPRWVIYSPAKVARLNKAGQTLPAETASALVPTNAWVDDEWDIQRRRGLKARGRLQRLLT